MVKVILPTMLRRLTKGKAELQIDARTIGELIDKLDAQFPGMKERLIDPNGELKRSYSIYLNSKEVKGERLKVELKPGDEVSIVPVLAGG
ncbi:molybdopterin synthase sulfur carrier subunit [Candidatus Poribacteria bacterium]|nr:MAG: molybdopterin synthase sulfur carrier subunit [Candidatus Poribacteria bacterium]